MLEEKREVLSALMDGELSREDTLSMIEALKTDVELQKTWQYYHRIQTTIQESLKKSREPLPDRTTSWEGCFEIPVVIHIQYNPATEIKSAGNEPGCV